LGASLFFKYTSNSRGGYNIIKPTIGALLAITIVLAKHTYTCNYARTNKDPMFFYLNIENFVYMTWHLANYMRMCHPNHRIVIFVSTMRKYCSICSLLEVLVLTPIYGIILYGNAIIFYYTSIYDLLWICNCIPSL